jgi:hypothetical protein
LTRRVARSGCCQSISMSNPARFNVFDRSRTVEAVRGPSRPVPRYGARYGAPTRAERDEQGRRDCGVAAGQGPARPCTCPFGLPRDAIQSVTQARAREHELLTHQRALTAQRLLPWMPSWADQSSTAGCRHSPARP